MTVFTLPDRDDWLATKITVAKETCNNHSARIQIQSLNPTSEQHKQKNKYVFRGKIFQTEYGVKHCGGLKTN